MGGKKFFSKKKIKTSFEQSIKYFQQKKEKSTKKKKEGKHKNKKGLSKYIYIYVGGGEKLEEKHFFKKKFKKN